MTQLNNDHKYRDPIIYTDYGTLTDPITKLKNESDPIIKIYQKIANFMRNPKKLLKIQNFNSITRNLQKTQF